MTKSDTADAPDIRDLRVRLEEYINKTDYVSFAERVRQCGIHD